MPKQGSGTPVRHLVDRVLGTPLARRAFSSIRWRTGLDAELRELESRLARVEESLIAMHRLPRLSTRGSAKAHATPRDADLLEVILLRMGRRNDDSLKVLEWGCGLSTLHYPEWLRSSGVRVSWVALEHDRGFFEERVARAVLARNGRVVRFEELDSTLIGSAGAEELLVVVLDEGALDVSDESPTRDEDRRKPLDDYVRLPAALGLRFDVVIVDGRKRRRCLIEASSLLRPGGIVLLHDAQRPYYACALHHFRSGRRIGDELWIGAQDDVDFGELVPASALASPGFDFLAARPIV